MNNTGVTSLTPKKGFEHARGPRNSAYTVNLTYDRHTTYRQYISPEISIEHPSVGLASLAQLLFHDWDGSTWKYFPVMPDQRIAKIDLLYYFRVTIDTGNNERLYRTGNNELAILGNIAPIKLGYYRQSYNKAS